MFKWLKKKKEDPIDTIVEQEDLVESDKAVNISFAVDTEGDGYIDCYWDTRVHPKAHMLFAELFFNISSGEMTEETLEILGESAKDSDRLEEYLQCLDHIRKQQTEKLKEIMAQATQSFASIQSDTVVVKPTEMFDSNTDMSLKDLT